MSEAVPSTSDDKQGLVEQFCTFTGASESAARITLEACNWNVELAINMHVDGIDTGESEDVIPTGESSTNNLSSSVPTQSNSPEVRPPIPPVRQVLVDDGFAHRLRNTSHSVFDGFRNFRAETRWLETGESATENKRRTLEELFRPPLDLLFRGSMDNAREYASHHNKWLMVNIQNVQEFACQVLNRDLWSNQAVKEIVSAHFVFWQIYHDSYEGSKYMQFYNVTSFPYIAILDPRTGEKMSSWSNGSLDPVTFCDKITDFLLEHPSPDGSVQPKQPQSDIKKKQKPYEDSEEMQISAAIAASLEENHKGQADSSCLNHHHNNFQIDTDSDEGTDLESSHSESEGVSNSKSRKESKNDISNRASFSSQPLINEPCTSKEAESWQEYLAPDNGKKADIIIRFPDGKREQKSFPAESPIKILFLYVSHKGYNMDEYDLVTNFPRQNLRNFADDTSLESAGLFPANTVYLHMKS